MTEYTEFGKLWLTMLRDSRVAYEPGELKVFSKAERSERTETRDDLAARLFAILTVVEQKLGPKGAELVRRFADKEIGKDELTTEIEKAPDFASFQEVALAYLEQIRIVEYAQGNLIIDLEKLKKFTAGFVPVEGFKHNSNVGAQTYKRAVNDLKPYFDYYNGGTSDFLFNAFYGKKVLSKEDWIKQKKDTKGKIKTKTLFYSPTNKESAFDAEEIKQADFYLGLWQVKGDDTEDSYSQFHKELPAKEVSLACVIYHPNYGNGQRDEQGNLIVTYIDGFRRPITQEWLAKFGFGYDRKDNDNKFTRSPQVALKAGEMVSLQEAGLIKPEDFLISLQINDLLSLPLHRSPLAIWCRVIL